MKRLIKSLIALSTALFLAGNIVMPVYVFADDGDTTGQESGTEPEGDSGENAPLRAPAASQTEAVSVDATTEDQKKVVDRDVVVTDDNVAVGVLAIGHTAEVTVTGSVSGNQGIGVIAGDGSTVTVNAGTSGGDINAETIAILTVADDHATVNVTSGGSVNTESTASEDEFGIFANSFGEGAETTIDVKGDVTAGNVGIRVTNSDGDMNVHVGGNVTAKEENAITISNVGGESAGTTVIVVEGDVTGKESGVSDKDTLASPDNTVIIEGTLSASDGAPVVFENEKRSGTTAIGDPSNLNLTVWKIEPTNGLIAAERNTDTGELVSTEQTKEFEKNINYIIKIETNDKVTFSAEKEGGAATATATVNEKTYTYNVANEKDTVILKITNIADGYTLKAAYNGEGKETVLSKDSNGNYYIIVPKGGGIYLSVVAERDPSSDSDSDSGSDSGSDSRNENNSAAPSGGDYILPVIVPEVNEQAAAEERVRRIPKTADENDLRFWTILLLTMMGTAFVSSMVLIRTEE